MLMLNFLDSVKNDVFIINDIDGLRKANNKVYTASFDDPKNEFIPPPKKKSLDVPACARLNSKILFVYF